MVLLGKNKLKLHQIWTSKPTNCFCVSIIYLTTITVFRRLIKFSFEKTFSQDIIKFDLVKGWKSKKPAGAPVEDSPPLLTLSYLEFIVQISKEPRWIKWGFHLASSPFCLSIRKGEIIVRSEMMMAICKDVFASLQCWFRSKLEGNVFFEGKALVGIWIFSTEFLFSSTTFLVLIYFKIRSGWLSSYYVRPYWIWNWIAATHNAYYELIVEFHCLVFARWGGDLLVPTINLDNQISHLTLNFTLFLYR